MLCSTMMRNPICSLPVLLITLLVFSGCGNVLDYKPMAIGRHTEITVVMDTTLWQGPVGDAVREQLAPWIGTLPAPEPMFDVVNRPLLRQGDFDYAKKVKNVVFVAPLRDTTAEANFLRSVFDADAQQAIANGRSVVVPRRDQWRQSQQVFYVAADDEAGLIEALENAGEDMRYAFNTIIRQRVTYDMFEKARQFDLESELMDRHGYAVNAQYDYLIATDTSNFTWLRRILNDSWRSLFVYYVEGADPSMLTPEWIYETRDRLTKRYMEGSVAGYIKIDYRRELTTENINFLDRYGFETRGLWYMVDDGPDGKLVQTGGGGPFVSYTFYDQDSGRIYFVDGMVFAPGYEKREFLRHMESIAYTFRTAEEVRAAEAPQTD